MPSVQPAGARVLLETLVASGIDTCFMNPGTSEMQFVSALDSVPAMRGVLCLFEGVCSGAADGYARITGRPAATLLHLGPGLGNALANLHNARKARSPVVNIIGDHSTAHSSYDAPLTADVELFARTVSGFVRRVNSPGEMGAAAAAAVEAARTPPGQVATLIVPADHSWNPGGAPGAAVPPPARVLPDITSLAGKLHALGPRGALLLSGTALLEHGLEAAARIAASTGVRVFANRYAARYDRGGRRFSPQRLAYFPEPAGDMLAGVEDLFLVETAPPVSFFGYPNRRSEVAPEGCRYHVLAREDEDGAGALALLAAACGGDFLPREWQRLSLPPDGPLTSDSLGRVLAALLPEDAIVSDEMVSSGEVVNQHLTRAARHSLLPVTGGSIGQGLPLAVGAALAAPSRKVIALEADGSGMYTLQALWTMAREHLDVVSVILANRRYRILDVEMARTGAPAPGPRADEMMDLRRPVLDWVKMAEAHGVEAVRADTAVEFAAAFGAAVESRGPRLIEAILEEPA
jgi:acetolactate synthase-1/2/3 large subunit